MLEKDNVSGDTMVNEAYSPEPEIKTLPMMPLRGILVFPHIMIHLDAGRDRSINAIEEALNEENSLIFLAMQKDAATDEPSLEEIYDIGVVAQIRQMLKLPGGTVRLLVEGLYRAKISNVLQEQPFIMVETCQLIEDFGVNPLEMEALMRMLQRNFEEYAEQSKRISPEVVMAIENLEESNKLADMVISQLNISANEKQALLEELSVADRMEKIIAILDKEMEILEIERYIAMKVRQQVEKNQKEYYLREQLKAIREELGEGEERSGEVNEYRQKAQQAQLPDFVRERIESELKRLEKMPSMLAEATVVTTYLDTLLALPWQKSTEENTDILHAEKILDADHYGLTKAKERIIEYLAARQLSHNLKAPILCLVGPPGVGKTSLARSVARALNRNFVRMSLGGVRDEAEIRGHRRTYIGAMPGRIIQGLKQAGSNNPLFLLDEVDKLVKDYSGDPSSALLEALDPEQNNTFADHYVELPFDLSQVLFFTTANVRSDIPKPLQDRMEIIEISSYTPEEKLKIAARHLVGKQLKEHGLSKKQLAFKESALREMIRGYTREAGVRSLERQIAKVCRKICRQVVIGEEGPFVINSANLAEYLGAPRFLNEKSQHLPEIGVATGLAWTEVGGELLKIEVQTLPGKGKMIITGQLGDVMKESAQAGYTYIRSLSDKLALPADLEEKTDVHIHVPEGAIPKDGPSAGITMAAAMASQFTGRKLRNDIAMTGEITLRGKVLPVGGIKEKMLAAYGDGIKKVILPAENNKDLEEIPENIRNKMTFHLVDSMEQVLDLVLL